MVPGIRSIISCRRSRVAGRGGRFLTSLRTRTLPYWTGWKVCCFRNSWRSRSDATTNSINTILSHMGIHREINLFVLISLSGHEFKGSVDVNKRTGSIIYTYLHM
jgi:hypothetical protein